jgi:PRC-barrel domain protein
MWCVGARTRSWAALACVLLSGPAIAQGVPQSVDIAKVNVQKLPAGYRASKITGSSVVNDGNESIGKIDDLLVSSDGRPQCAVLSVGGFLGINSPYVVVPYQNLSLVDDKIVLPGATKDMLRMLPEFKYAAK